MEGEVLTANRATAISRRFWSPSEDETTLSRLYTHNSSTSLRRDHFSVGKPGIVSQCAANRPKFHFGASKYFLEALAKVENLSM